MAERKTPNLASLETEIKEEFDYCLRLKENPLSSPELFGIDHDEESLRRYYTYRAEGLGFALDAIERFKRVNSES